MLDYLTLLLIMPLVLLAANFVFGRCSVAERLDCRIDEACTRPRNRYYRIAGKLGVLFVVASIAWQLVEYQFRYRNQTHRSLQECNILFSIWYMCDAVVGWLMQGEGTLFDESDTLSLKRQITTCTNDDALFLSATVCLLICFVRCVFATPQRIGPSKQTSFCSKCRAHVDVMDHHCYLVHNCIGSDNRGWFVGMMACASALSSFLLCRCGGEYLQSDWISVELAALLWTTVVFVGSTCLLGFQVYLLSRGMTTVSYLKARGNK